MRSLTAGMRLPLTKPSSCFWNVDALFLSPSAARANAPSMTAPRMKGRCESFSLMDAPSLACRKSRHDRRPHLAILSAMDNFVADAIFIDAPAERVFTALLDPE